jgi:hypothetical protein
MAQQRQHYEKMAALAREQAESAADSKHRDPWLQIAAGYESLAETADRITQAEQVRSETRE